MQRVGFLAGRLGNFSIGEWVDVYSCMEFNEGCANVSMVEC